VKDDNQPPTMASYTMTIGTLVVTPLLLLGANPFAVNIGLAICWLFGVFGTLAGVALTFSDQAAMREMRARIARRPRWVRRSLTAADVPTLLVLAGLGHWVTFSVFALQAFLTTTAASKAEEEAQTARGANAGGTE
jgi:hypothetical protein